MNEESIETLLRHMRPQPLPADVCAALKESPVKFRPIARHRVMAIAAILLVGAVLCWLYRPDSAGTEPVLTIRHQ